MYDELIKRLRDAAKMSEALAVLLPQSEGNATAKLYNEAADAIEELQQTVKHYKGCADDWYKEACDYKARLERAKSMVICEAEHTLMFDDRDEKTLMEMAKSLPFQNLVLTDNTPRWISVEERLPEDGRYLVCATSVIGGYFYRRILSFTHDLESIDQYDFEGEKRHGWYWLDSEWGYCECRDVTHWMPLPEPPKEDKP